jgi:CIC family chloride channel protein
VTRPPIPAPLRRALDAVRGAAVAASLRLAPTEPQRIFGLTIVLGVACGFAAVAFHEAIRGAQALLLDRALEGNAMRWVPGLVLTPAIGGLFAGAFLKWIRPSAAGSGVPQVKIAYALDTSGVSFRDSIAKFVVCVVQLGSGASLGREGPTVQICAGLATSLSRWLALSPANLRRLIPVGAAAGVAAAFNAPIAAVTFTIEEVVGTLDQTVLSGVVVAAALAAVVEHSVLGTNPILHAPTGAGLHHASSLPLYALLGCAAAFVSVGFTDLLLAVRARSQQPGPVPLWIRPAIGGLATGVLAAVALALVDEQGIAGGGYATLTRALEGHLALHVLALLAVFKLLSTVASYSSGGAGGIFAPTLFMGAMLGGLLGGIDVSLFGHASEQEMTSFALVGMGAVFAGVIRAPITSVLIVFEMTGGYGLVLPLMIANSVAYVLARRMRPVPIYEALLAQDGVTLPHGTLARGSLSSIAVREAMTTQLDVLQASMTIAEGARLAAVHGHATYPVLEGERFIGLLSEARIQRTIAEGGADRPIGSVARRKEYLSPDEPLLRAVARMSRLGVRQLPVLAPKTHALVGIVAMSDVLRAQVRAETAGSTASEPGGDADADAAVIAESEVDDVSAPP